MKYLFFVFLIMVGLAMGVGYLGYDHVPPLTNGTRSVPGGSNQTSSALFVDVPQGNVGRGGGGVASDGNIIDLNNTIQDLEQQLKQAQAAQKTAQNKATNLQKKLTDAQAGKKTVEGQLGDLQKQLVQAQDDVKTADAKVSSLQDQLGELQGQLDQARSDVKTAEAKAVGLQNQLDQVQADLKTALDQNVKDKAAIGLLQQQNAQLQADAKTAWTVAYAGIALGVVAAIMIVIGLALGLRWRKQQAASTTWPAPYEWSDDRQSKRFRRN